MTKVKEKVKPSKVMSDSAAVEMDPEIVEEDKEVEDEVEEQLSEEQEVEEEDSKEEEDEDELDDETTNEHLQPEQKVDTGDVSKGTAKDKANRVEDNNTCDEFHEEDPVYEENEDDVTDEDKPKDSDHNDVKMHSIPAPGKSADTDGQLNEKTYENNEQGSIESPGEQHLGAVSKCNRYVKCEKGTGNGCVSGSDGGRDVTFCGSSAMDHKNLIEVKDEQNLKEMTSGVEKAKDGLTAVESTEPNQMFMFDDASEGGESGTEEEQLAFMKELENLFREKCLDFKPPKFYGEPLNLLKLWRSVIKLGGYDKVTACKLWRQVGESFNPPKTCTTVSWTFRIFYEKALLEYERHKISGGELHIPPTATDPVNMESPAINTQASGSGRARRDAAARAMQGWHSQRLLGNGEVGDPIIKDKSPISLKSREKHLKNIGVQKRKKPLAEPVVKASRSKLVQTSSDTAVIDVGPPAEWVKINVRTTKDCYEVYALVPGLLREEVRVQSDPAGRLVISGEPENVDNPWGVTPFKKVVSLPSRIDPHQTSAVVTLHGQLFIRVPFEQSD